MSAPRCKPGQLARYIGNDPLCTGWIVLCVELHAFGTAVCGEPMWVTAPCLPSVDGKDEALATADRLLKPLDNPGEDETDEMVLKVGKPEEVTA